MRCVPYVPVVRVTLTIGSLLSVGALCEDCVHLVEGESSPENPRDHGPRCLGLSYDAPSELGGIPLADDDMSSGRTSRQARSVAAGEVRGN